MVTLEAPTRRSLTFVVPGAPVPWARAARGKGGRTYTPEAQKQHAEQIGWLARQMMAAHHIWTPLRGPLSLSVTFVYPGGTADAYRTARPDLDNLVKQIMDGCTGVAFRDDAEVVHLRAAKVQGGDTLASTVVVLVELGPTVTSP